MTPNYKWKRTKVAFTTTVHKSQSETYDFVSVDLRVPVFMHGMLYVIF